jgi:thiamine transporter ThiT
MFAGSFAIFIFTLIAGVIYFPRFVEGMTIFVLFDALYRAKAVYEPTLLLVCVVGFLLVEYGREHVRFIPQAK